MAAVSSVSTFSGIKRQSFDSFKKISARNLSSNFEAFKLRLSFFYGLDSVNISYSNSEKSRCFAVHCMSTARDVPTVSETKLNFLKAYKRPIPSIYGTVLQELLVQQHLMRYKRTYKYDAVFALGFVTVYDRLMEGYPSDEDREAIFQAYIKALKEEPEKYRSDAQKLEEWACTQNAGTLVDFSSRKGEVESILKDIAERAGSKEGFSYSRFFAIGLFRLLELANATEPAILEKLCAALNVNKKSVDRDLDVYRNLLSKLVQAKELLKEYVDREKKKREERAESQKASEAVKKCLVESQYAGS
ncbi:protein THYLAKOID FORMATION1, chloroplastic-like [Coffea arabica]|uniref:Protein THYLAKOID FORMATION1, chloroplastic-like n=1 Tax=Coffea arabica TaxID=13443 RepID=A0ABM4UIE4_COFAR